jgi:hypothetical protein
MRNWEQEQIIKKHLLGCYIDPETKMRIKALARARRISISQLTREMIEFALPRLEVQAQHDLSTRP